MYKDWFYYSMRTEAASLSNSHLDKGLLRMLLRLVRKKRTAMFQQKILILRKKAICWRTRAPTFLSQMGVIDWTRAKIFLSTVDRLSTSNVRNVSTGAVVVMQMHIYRNILRRNTRRRNQLGTNDSFILNFTRTPVTI